MCDTCIKDKHIANDSFTVFTAVFTTRHVFNEILLIFVILHKLVANT